MHDFGEVLNMNSLSETVQRLCEVSEKNYLNPYSYISWPQSMDMNQLFMSPELLSIYGTPIYDSLSEEQINTLSFFEAINFFSLNIHGEKSLVEGIAKRLYSKDFKEIASYLHHFLDEENKHMIYFGGFCRRYAGKVYRDRKMLIPREYAAGEEDFLFFARIMIFEEIVDVYNIRMAADERIEATARKINNIHHLEEARHLVFGRLLVEHLFEKHSRVWTAQVLEGVQKYLKNYVVSTWKEYYNPDVYKDGKLDSPYDLVEAAWNNEDTRQLRRNVSARVVSFLKERKMILEEPEL